MKTFITAREYPPDFIGGDESASNSSRNKILRSLATEYFIPIAKKLFLRFCITSLLYLFVSCPIDLEAKDKDKKAISRIEHYYNCGKTCFDKKEYSLSIFYFKRTIELEKKFRLFYTPYSKEYIQLANDRILREGKSLPTQQKKYVMPGKNTEKEPVQKGSPEYIIGIDDSLQVIIWESPRVDVTSRTYAISKGDILHITIWKAMGVLRSEKYIIGIGDRLYIYVWQNSDLNQEAIVRPDGMISFPLAGDIPASGLTITELDKELTRRLEKYIKYADISISFKETGVPKMDKDIDLKLMVRPDGMISFPYTGDIKAAGLTISRLDKILTKKLEKSIGRIDVSVSLDSIGKVEPNIYYNYFKDFDQETIVRPDGKISFPFAGDIQAAGLTIPQLDKALTKRIKRYYKYYQVSVMLKKISGNKVILLGDVTSPGVYEIKGTQTLLEAIAMGGGFTRDAVLSSIIVIRNGFKNPMGMKFNLSRAIKKSDVSQNIALRPGDIIFVPRTFISDASYVLNQILTPISSGINIASGVQNMISTRQSMNLSNAMYKEVQYDWELKRKHEKEHDEDRAYELEKRKREEEKEQ